MGLSIHYSGQLKDADLLMDLVKEVQDVARVYDWKCYIHDTGFPDNKFSKEISFDKIFGINFTPTNCETISIVFLSNGVMVCPSRLHFFADSKNKREHDWIYTTSVKTQYAGIKIHQFIIIFLKYLNSKYFDNFKLLDESSYWETNDEEKIKKQFQKYDILIDNFALAIETLPVQNDESIFTYFERIMKNVNGLERK